MRSIYVASRLFLILLLISYELGSISAGKSKNKSIDDKGETANNDESQEESLEIPMENKTNLTCARRQNSQMHEITAAAPKQFPFVAGIMSQQQEYLCSGTVVSNGLILTSAQCLEQPPSYVLINTTKDKKDDTVVMLRVVNIEKFPSYTGEESPMNVGLIYTEKLNDTSSALKIRVSNYTNHQSIVDLKAVGFGLNANVGQVKELQYVGLEHRSPFVPNSIHAYLDCVETGVLTCFKDVGGPAIFDNELIGIVVKGQEECAMKMSGTFATNKRLVNVLPTYTFKTWLDEKIKKNEEGEQISLRTYALKPVLREKKIHKMTGSMVERISPNLTIFLLFSLIYF